MMGRIVALALVFAACGGSGAVTDTETEAPAASSASSVEQPGATVDDSSEPTESVPAAALAETRQRPEGRDAPDFTLALGQGGEFSLSGEQKPVYMVFWAEW